MRTALEAARPVLELEVGGNSDPQVLEVTADRNGWRLDHEESPGSRPLVCCAFDSRAAAAIGTIEDVQLRIRWPNGFIQSGPSVGDITLEPRVDFEPSAGQGWRS